MSEDYVIFQEDGLFGCKNPNGEVVIQPQYMEMYPFSCGLSLVRNTRYQYAYIDVTNRQVVPFGTYLWCDSHFTCGFARVLGNITQKEKEGIPVKNKWGIIDTLGNIVVPLKYDSIWRFEEQHLFSVKAFINDKEERLNLHELGSNVILDGLTYICTYSVEAFKKLVNCQKLRVMRYSNSKLLYFTYGANKGVVASYDIPKEPVVSIVANSSGKIFPLLMEKSDVGKPTLLIEKEEPKASSGQGLQDDERGHSCEAESKEGHMEWPLAFGLEKTGYPLILISGKLKSICFLIDTGSTHNILFNFVYERFKDEFRLLDKTHKTMGIEGHYKETPVMEATFNFEGTDYTSTFSVLDASEAVAKIQEETGCQIHGILGVPFLMENKWIVDFEKLVISRRS